MATAKTTKKVVTPIDERETFVSLQKSFGETGLSVEEKLKTLYDLQQTDNEIEKILQLRGELPEEVSSLQAEIAALEAKVARMNELISGLTATITENEAQIVDLDADIAKYQGQLDNISNSREFDSINKEIENLGLLRQIAIKHITEAKDNIEARKNDIDFIGEKIAVRSADLDAKQAELDTISESTAAEEQALRERRNAFVEKLDERTVSAYDRIRASVNNHLAVVAVYGGDSCGGCFSAVTPQRLEDIASGRKLVICEHCGRIIVNPDPVAE